MIGTGEGASGDGTELDPRLIAALGNAAKELTGFSLEAIQPEALRRSARELLAIWPPEELHSRIHLRDELVARSLRLAVSVGETYFFRQPEHFHFIAETLAPAWIASGVARVRAWSAGCATGEEAFSIAACLQSVLATAPIAIDVLGTDLLTRNLAVARSATYGAWSQRPSSPLLAPLLRQLEGPPGAPPLVRILDKVRAAVRFQEHNLLELSGEPEPFDLIFCRNVLVYFSPEAARHALAHLSHALAPGGVLMLGSMDLNVTPPDLLREGTPESLIFRKRAVSSPPRVSSKPMLAAIGEKPPALISNPGATRLPDTPQPGRTSGPGQPPLATAPGARTTTPGARTSGPGALSALSARTSGPGATPLTPPEQIELHLRALMQIERGELELAERSLRSLLASAPAYLPGMFERALLHLRRGEPAAATLLMREVHRRASALQPGENVAGPEPLEARFYIESAEAYLRGGRG